jgi:hypothetical protein
MNDFDFGIYHDRHLMKYRQSVHATSHLVGRIAITSNHQKYIRPEPVNQISIALDDSFPVIMVRSIERIATAREMKPHESS